MAGESCGWFAPTYTYLDTIWSKIVKHLEPLIAKKDGQKHRIRFTTGAVLHCWSCEKDDPGRGEKYHRAAVDEAGIVRNFQRVWFESISPTLVDYSGNAVIQGTPKGSGRGFVKLHQIAQQGLNGYAAFSGKTIDNPRIPREEIERARSVMTLDSFRQEYEGIPAADGANPFGIDAIRSAISTGIEGPAIVYGIDLASSSDYTVIIGINEQGQACSMERFQGGWEVITKRVRNAVRDTYSLVDSTGVGSPVVQRLQLDGNNIVGFQFTNSSKQSLMTELAAAFQTKDIQIPDDSVLVNELESFGYEYNHTGNVVRYATQPGMHDDCVCALALAWKAYQDNHGPRNSMPRIFAASPIQTRMDRRPGVRTCL